MAQAPPLTRPASRARRQLRRASRRVTPDRLMDIHHDVSDAETTPALVIWRSAEGLSSGLLCADWARDSNFEELHRPGGERRVLVRGEVHRVRDGIAVRFNPRHQHGA